MKNACPLSRAGVFYFHFSNCSHERQDINDSGELGAAYL